MTTGRPRVLVAGGTGFLGTPIARRLRADGFDVVVASRATGVDLSDPGAVAALPPCEAVVHVAGGPSAREPEVEHPTITRNLLEFARRSGARLVLASTFVYGASPRVPASEADAPRPHTRYAASRLASEELGRAYQRDFGVPVDALRVFNAYGPGQPAAFVVPTIVAGALAGRIELADPAPRRDFVHVDDVARAFALAAGRRSRGFDVFNVGSGESRSVDSVAQAAARLAGGRVEIAYSGAVRGDEVPEARADVRKAARVLRWRAETGFDAGLASLIASAREARR